VISAQESDNYRYKALEWGYGPSVPEDADADQFGKVIVLSGELTNLNLRTVYNGLFPDIEPDDDVRFIFDTACTAGSTTELASVDTGSWPELDTPPLIDIRGLLIGKGGNGASFDAAPSPATPPQDGGTALRLQNDIRLSNTGILGGGGGGGPADSNSDEGLNFAAGGGGAGFVLSTAGAGTGSTNPAATVVPPQAGTKTLGGAGSVAFTAAGGKGGDLGQDGGNLTIVGGLAGAAIDTNGYTITYTGAGAGDIRGAII
jgi:hypothetical protein